MSNKDILARVLKGTARTELLYVPELETDGCGGLDGDGEPDPDCDGVLQVRPLTHLEEQEVTAAEVTGQTVRGKPGEQPEEQEIALGASAEGQARGQRIAVAYGLSIGSASATPSQIGRMDPRAVKRIAARVREMTGGRADEAAQFRGYGAGGDDSDSAPDRATDSDEPSGPDA